MRERVRQIFRTTAAANPRIGYSIASIGFSLLFAISPAMAASSAIAISIGPPGAITTDARGNVYFSTPNLVYRLNVNGDLARVAGSAQPGFSGDGGLATAAQFDFPMVFPELLNDPADYDPLIGGLAVDAAGNLYIADAYNGRVRRVDREGFVNTIAGSGIGDFGGDGGPATSAGIGWPQGVAIDATGLLYISDAWGSLRRVGREGDISTLASNNCGPGFLGPGLCAPATIAVDGSGNVFVPDGYCRVRVVRPDGSVATIAGDDRDPDANHGFAFTCGYSGDGGRAYNAVLANSPQGIAVDGNGNLYIADTGNSCIRRVDANGNIATFAGVCTFPGYSGDGGPALQAQLHFPFGVAVDALGNVYIADTSNNSIRKVSASGVITTVAGNGGAIPTVLAAPAPPTTVPVIEYYNAAQDHYFMTWVPDEIARLDAGIENQGWQRTGYSFQAYPTAQAGASDICRFYIPPAAGDSHFYGRDSIECAATSAAHPNFVLEDAKFMAMFLPTAGMCPSNTTEVYRVFDNRPDANHRYMTDRTLEAQMVAKGWVAEGDGPNLVVMCAPQ